MKYIAMFISTFTVWVVAQSLVDAYFANKLAGAKDYPLDFLKKLAVDDIPDYSIQYMIATGLFIGFLRYHSFRFVEFAVGTVAGCLAMMLHAYANYRNIIAPGINQNMMVILFVTWIPSVLFAGIAFSYGAFLVRRAFASRLDQRKDDEHERDA